MAKPIQGEYPDHPITLYRRDKTKNSQTGIQYDLKELTDGEYRVKWWDTHADGIVATDRVEVQGGRCPLKVPSFLSDVAFTITRESR